jgi:hypothetical protein
VAIAELSDLKLHLGITTTDKDAELGAVLSISNQAVLSFLGRPVELAERTEYHDGYGMPDIVLRVWPVVFSYTGSDGVTVTCEPQCWVDPTGYYGDNPDGAFDDDTELEFGSEFTIRRDDSVPTSDCVSNATYGRSGILRRLGTSIRGDVVLGRPASSLASRYRQAVWPVGQGNVKVTYTAGYPVMPADITGAALQMAALVYKTKTWGGGFINAGARLGEYSRGLVQALNGSGPMADQVGTFAMMLNPYRDLIV